MAPNVLQQIVDVLPPDALTRICDNLRNAPHDLHLQDSRSIIDPKWGVDLENVAPRIGEALASGEIRQIPAARKTPNSPKYPGYPQ